MLLRSSRQILVMAQSIKQDQRPIPQGAYVSLFYRDLPSVEPIPDGLYTSKANTRKYHKEP